MDQASNEHFASRLYPTTILFLQTKIPGRFIVFISDTTHLPFCNVQKRLVCLYDPKSFISGMLLLGTPKLDWLIGLNTDQWTILIVRKETCCRHIGYSYRLTARVLLYAPSHRQEHWLEREIAQWVHPMKDRSDDPSHHEQTLYL